MTSRRAWSGLTRGAVAVVIMGVVLVSPRASAEPKDPVARKHLEKGQAAVARDDYDAAMKAYQKALDIEREPKVLYLMGQAEFLRGRCRESVGWFKQVKEFEVSPAVEDAMRPYLAECAERLLDESESVPDPQPEEPAESESDRQPKESDESNESDEPIEPRVPPDEESSSARRWYQDPLGDSLVALGVVGAGAGASMWLVARSRRTGAANYGALEDAASGIQTLRIAGGAALGVGTALIIGGVIRWSVVSRRGRTQTTAGVLYDGRVAGATLHVHF